MKRNLIILGSVILIIVVAFIVWLFFFRANISKNEALNIAYEYLGKTESEFSYTKVKKDRDDRCYDIELNDGTYIYDIDIDFKNGEVVDFEKKSISNVTSDEDSLYISVEEAKKIALDNVNLNESDVVFFKTNLENENGNKVYEIEFMYNHKDYEYEIDAKNGSILKVEIDR